MKKNRIPRKRALTLGVKWLNNILLKLYKTCYVFDPKVDEKEAKSIAIKYLSKLTEEVKANADKFIEGIAKETNRKFDFKAISEKSFIKAVVAVEAALEMLDEALNEKVVC